MNSFLHIIIFHPLRKPIVSTLTNIMYQQTRAHAHTLIFIHMVRFCVILRRTSVIFSLFIPRDKYYVLLFVVMCRCWPVPSMTPTFLVYFAPVTIVVVINFILYTIVIFKTTCNRTKTQYILRSNQKASRIRELVGSLALFVLMGKSLEGEQ